MAAKKKTQKAIPAPDDENVDDVAGASEKEDKGGEAITISKPKFKTIAIKIRGIAPYVQHKFSARKRQGIHETQEAGSVGKKGKKREARDFKRDFIEAQHRSEQGWFGLPASGLRAAMVSACRLCGFKMTHAKLGCFILADGYDPDDGTPLVRVTKGQPVYFEAAVRNATGVLDLRARPKLNPGWESIVRITFDSDMMSTEDVSNLLMRVGLQVGIGEGRPDSRKSCGQGWGLFELVQE